MSTGPVWTIVLAGGGGSRFGGRKQYADLAGRTLLERTLDTALLCCDGVVVVLPAGDSRRALDRVEPPPGVELRAVPGGAVRAESVRAGLAAAPQDATVLAVADAAHPLAGTALYRRVIDAVLAGADGAIPGLPLTDATATLEPGPEGVLGVTGTTTAAAGRVHVQTPHAFRADLLRAAHASGVNAVEDSSMVAALGASIHVVPGDPANLHVTTPEELELAHRLLATAPASEASRSSRSAALPTA